MNHRNSLPALACPGFHGVMVALGAALLVAGAGRAADGRWQKLFDGHSLQGWKAAENPGAFTVEDGKIKVNGRRGHLFYVGPVSGGVFKNFEFEAEVMTRPRANSGIFFHTKYQRRGWPGVGYECQVNTSHGDSIKTGSIYNVVKVNPAPSNDNEWFTQNITVRNKRITVAINGKVVVDYTEPPNVRGTRKLSQGTFALQAHDPGSTVYYRSIKVKPLGAVAAAAAKGMTRAQRVAAKPGNLKWWDRMDYGPFLSSTVGVRAPASVVLKGITMQLGDSQEASATFDTELLRMAAGWKGRLKLEGTTYKGNHGGFPLIDRTPIFGTKSGPGWGKSGNFSDPRKIPHGPLPRDWAKYRGLYRYGEKTILSYTVGDAQVLELPWLETHDGVEAITRTLNVGPRREALTMVVADVSGAALNISADGTWAGGAATPARSKPGRAAANKVIVVADRTNGSWDELAMGAPVNHDRAQQGVFTWVAGFGRPHSQAGAQGDRLPRVNDGNQAGNQDDTGRSLWIDGSRARMVADLRAVVNIARINTYTWHKSNRAPQSYTLWGSKATRAPNSKGKDPARAGWTRIASVDTWKLGEGGKHGTAVANEGGAVGSYRHLLWDWTNKSQQYGAFISEIDVLKVGSPLPALKAPRQGAAAGSLSVGLAGGSSGAKLAAGRGGRILLHIPAGRSPIKLKLLLTSSADAAAAIAKNWPAPADLTSMTKGGPALWTETVTVQGKQATGTGANGYVVDDIPVPFKNPWASYMRLGGFDFFSDGKRAAVCTWNGDVWILSGLGGTRLGTITWKRYATGLFETLGLKIVDDVVYVNGKDQITRLHDLNRDGEADFYECFNNDVMITKSFHEFTFDLQTGPNGDFFFSKAGPVRNGGRGFDKIVPHHGTILRVSRDGSYLDVYSTGLRAPNGIGVGPDGQVTAGDNEGSWVPHCKLHWLKPGSFQGVIPTAHRQTRPTAYNKPLCWFPMGVDNSGGGQVWVTSKKWGPFTGDLLHLSYGKSSIFKVMKEEVDGQIQGGVVKIPVRINSSAMRGRFNPRDGQLYVCGLKGWQTNAPRLAAIQRIRYTGSPVRLPTKLRVTNKGVHITFTCKLDARSVQDPDIYGVEQWNYVWGPMYGSGDFSVNHPDPARVKRAMRQESHRWKKMHDKVPVKSARLLADGRTVFLEIPGIRTVMQMQIKYRIKAADGTNLSQTIYNTINKLGRE